MPAAKRLASVAAIPKEWKEYFTANPCSTYFPLPPHNIDRILNGSIPNITRKLYTYFSEDAIWIHGKFVKWRMDLGQEYSQGLIEFKEHHQRIYKTTNITKYRSFQYRLLQRGIITNIQLSKWNIKPSDKCYYCNEEKETLIHLCCTCPKIQELWEQVKEYLQKKFPRLEIQLVPTNIIFNTITGKNNHVANFICLIVKQYVYSQRCLGKDINIQGVIGKIKQMQMIEKYIATKNEKLPTHLRKWGEIQILGEGNRNELHAYTVEYLQQM